MLAGGIYKCMIGSSDGYDLLPAETEIPAPAITIIFFFFRSTDSSRSNCVSSSSSRSARSRYSVVRGLRSATLRLLAGGGPSVLTWISPAASESFIGEALPELSLVELGDGYRFEASIRIGDEGGEGDLDKTDSGEEGGEEDTGCARGSMLAGATGWARGPKPFSRNKEGGGVGRQKTGAASLLYHGFVLKGAFGEGGCFSKW